jgi:hypothetical protein
MPGVGASASATAQAEPTVEVTPESEPAPEGTEAEQTDSTALLQAVSAGANRQQGENDLESRAGRPRGRVPVRRRLGRHQGVVWACRRSGRARRDRADTRELRRAPSYGRSEGARGRELNRRLTGRIRIPSMTTGKGSWAQPSCYPATSGGGCRTSCGRGAHRRRRLMTQSSMRRLTILPSCCFPSRPE